MECETGRFDRRTWLGRVAGSAVGAWAVRSVARGGQEEEATGPRWTVRNRRPLDAETPVELFDQYLTPTDWFFVRSHLPEPMVDAEGWFLEVGGDVKRPLRLTLADLEGFERVSRPAVLQCAGNGRAFFRPAIPGVKWERGAVGNAEWSGVRLRDILERAGVREGTRHVHFRGADRPPLPKTPEYLRSLPLERAGDATTLIATHMNGVPIPALHGGPLRLVVPTWTGNHWMKWLRSIVVAREEAPGFYMQTGYRVPRRPVEPGVVVPPEDLVPVTAMNVKSLIARPVRGRRLRAGETELCGVAWTGPGRVVGVEIRIDDGPWEAARLEGPDEVGSWRLWRLPWKAEPGVHRIAARARDSEGNVQENTTPWNKSGYLRNAIDVVEVEVGA